MPGNTPGEAVQAFIAPIKTAISCLCAATLQYTAHPALHQLQGVVLNAGEAVRVRSSMYEWLYLELTLNFVVIEDEGLRGPYRCSSRGYVMSLNDSELKELVSFHWHPLSKVTPAVAPHFHIGEARVPQVGRLHVPTPRVTVEEFVRLAVDSFGADTTVDEETWREVLSASQALHEEHRTWHDHRGSPTFD